MRTLFCFLLLMITPLWSQNQGHASVALWVGTPKVVDATRQEIPVAVRMVYDEGWHGYWSNPGEGGMKTEVTWTLPAGWSAGPLLFPTPKREMTGDLACYGYEGEVLLPVLLSAPVATTGPQRIEATVTWLACDEKGCVPGEAKLQATVPAAAVAPTQAQAIAAAIANLPVVDEKVALDVAQAGDWITLTLTGAEHRNLDGAEIFPLTEQALDPREAIHWKKSASGYEARVKKNEYAAKELAQLTLVIALKAPLRALQVEWKK